jgi:hypothetical protein
MNKDYTKILEESSVLMSDSLKSRRSTKTVRFPHLVISQGTQKIAQLHDVVSFRKSNEEIEIKCNTSMNSELISTMNSIPRQTPLVLNCGGEEFSVRNCKEWALIAGMNPAEINIELIFELADFVESKEILTG